MDVRIGADFSALSSRESEVLGLATQGRLDKQISEDLGVSQNTLRTYWTRIRQKVGDLPRAALVAAFIADKVRAQHGEAPKNPFENSVIVDAESGLALATDDINLRLGYSPGKHRAFTDYTGALHPDDRPTGLAAMERLFHGEEDIVHLVFREVNNVGILTMNATLTSLRSDDGRVRWVYVQGLEVEDCRPPTEASFMVGHWVRRWGEPRLKIDEGMAKIFGLGGVESVTVEQYQECVSAQEYSEMEEAVARAILDGAPEMTLEMRFTAYDGVERYGRSQRRFVYNDDGTVDVYGELIVFD